MESLCTDASGLLRSGRAYRNAETDRALPGEGGNADLAKLLRFEQRLVGLSAKFINLPLDQVDQEIENGLAALMEALDADRTTLAQTDRETGDFVVTHSYMRSGIPRFPQRVVKKLLP